VRLAAGVPVITYTPANGRALTHLPTKPVAEAEMVSADVLAVPRVRRSSAYPRSMLLPAGASSEQVEVLAALRLEPGERPDCIPARGKPP